MEKKHINISLSIISLAYGHFFVIILKNYIPTPVAFNTRHQTASPFTRKYP